MILKAKISLYGEYTKYFARDLSEKYKCVNPLPFLRQENGMIKRLIRVNLLEKLMLFSNFATEFAELQTVRNGKENQILKT